MKNLLDDYKEMVAQKSGGVTWGGARSPLRTKGDLHECPRTTRLFSQRPPLPDYDRTLEVDECWLEISDSPMPWPLRASPWEVIGVPTAALSKYFSLSERRPDLSAQTRELFCSDRDQWRSDTRFSSNLSAKLNHPAYLRIIALGKDILPLILEDLRDGGGHWFEALRAITRDDPVPPEHRSWPRLMREDWLRWGVEKGFINDPVEV